jgi:hypothetical protein
MFKQLDHEWNQKGYGYQFPDEGQRISYGKLADNLVVFASSLEMGKQMLDELVWEIHMRGMDVKATSTSFMLAGPLCKESCKDFEIITMKGFCSWVRVQRFELLGTVISEDASSRDALEFRLSKADGQAWQLFRAVRTKTSFQAMLSAWAESVQQTATYGLSHIHWTKELLTRARVWELAWLRKLWRLRPRLEDSLFSYRSRTAKFAMAIFSQMGLKPLHLTLNYFKINVSLWCLLGHFTSHIPSTCWDMESSCA